MSGAQCGCLKCVTERSIQVTLSASRGPLSSMRGINPFSNSPRESEFEGREVGVGVVTGARSFKVDRLGRLTGVNYQTVWTPGTNEARCLLYGIDIGEIPPEVEGELLQKHDMATCQHGFYAYYDGSDDYHKPGMVSGVVEGFGETLIGSRGFRCAKARILALHIPDDVRPALRRRIAANYPDVPTFDSFEAMVREVPTDAGQDADPSQPDFWTRKA